MKKEAKQFVEDLRAIKNYWIEAGKDAGYDTAQTCNGLVFSILSYIDGCAGANDCHMFLITDSVTGVVINDEDMLHEHYYTKKEKK